MENNIGPVHGLIYSDSGAVAMHPHMECADLGQR